MAYALGAPVPAEQRTASTPTTSRTTAKSNRWVELQPGLHDGRRRAPLPGHRRRRLPLSRPARPRRPPLRCYTPRKARARKPLLRLRLFPQPPLPRLDLARPAGAQGRAGVCRLRLAEPSSRAATCSSRARPRPRPCWGRPRSCSSTRCSHSPRRPTSERRTVRWRDERLRRHDDPRGSDPAPRPSSPPSRATDAERSPSASRPPANGATSRRTASTTTPRTSRRTWRPRSRGCANASRPPSSSRRRRRPTASLSFGSTRRGSGLEGVERTWKHRELRTTPRLRTGGFQRTRRWRGPRGRRVGDEVSVVLPRARRC